MASYSFSIFPNESFLDLRLYQYGWEQCAPLHSFGPFVRNHYLFHYVISGQGYLDADDKDGVNRRFHLSANQGFLICPGQVTTYCADFARPWKYAWLEFDGLRAKDCLEQAGLALEQPVYTPRTVPQGEAVRDEMLAISAGSEASALQLIGHLYLFMDGLIRSSVTRQEPRAAQLREFYVHEAVTYMEQNYHRELTVEEIAGACRLNRSYFSKLFREEMGCPPQEFLIRLRLSKAADLMTGSQSSIGDIAALCGYANQLHFSRAFKKRYGLSPREWRAQNRVRHNGAAE